MTTTGNAIATRNGSAPAYQDAALSIRPGQTTWDEFQNAALNQLGLADAPNADRAVFLHQCQRTGLDPFAKQIMMIGRKEKKSEKRGNQWVDVWTTKWTIQTGIDGWRTIRDRAERREGVRGVLSRFTYYDHEDNERKVWTRREPPAAVEVTYTVRDRNGVETPYTSVLRFDEYVQTKKVTQNGAEVLVPVAQWAVKRVHMTEKCTEADVYRKTFPQDYAGIELSDAMPPPDPDEPAEPPRRQRVSAEQARARNPRTVTATVVTTDASPAGEQPPPAAPPVPPSGQPAGEAPVSRDQVTALWACLTQDYGYAEGEKDVARAAVGVLAGRPVTSLNDLTREEASGVLGQLREWAREAKKTGERARDILAADIASRDADPREDGESGE